MPTKISFQTWSGGDGSGDPVILIGYCKEEPRQVLKHVYKDHYIYHYRDLYRPVDWNYPNNVIGLIISEVSSDKCHLIGCEIVGLLKDLDLSKAYNSGIKRDSETFREGIANATSWHSLSGELKPKYREQLKEVEEIIFS
jgi:hypothetical protein